MIKAMAFIAFFNGEVISLDMPPAADIDSCHEKTTVIMMGLISAMPYSYMVESSMHLCIAPDVQPEVHSEQVVG